MIRSHKALITHGTPVNSRVKQTTFPIPTTDEDKIRNYICLNCTLPRCITTDTSCRCFKNKRLIKKAMKALNIKEE